MDLQYLETQGFLQIFYADESGFSLATCVPYGWQEKGNTIRMMPQRRLVASVFGLMAKNNSFESYIIEESVDSQTIIGCIDDFAKRITQRSVVVLDNAPVHRSAQFKANIQRWRDQDLYIFYLPKYSPHLNLIENLWRKIKYQWIKPMDYRNKETFMAALEKILTQIGHEFTINFKEQEVTFN